MISGRGGASRRALDDAEQDYVVEAICLWIVGQYAPHRPPP
ncbi:hypothetical protein [Nonomuraea sp. NPDC049784]